MNRNPKCQSNFVLFPVANFRLEGCFWYHQKEFSDSGVFLNAFNALANCSLIVRCFFIAVSEKSAKMAKSKNHTNHNQSECNAAGCSVPLSAVVQIEVPLTFL